MVTFVWYILSLLGVCEFTWLPVFIEAFIAVFAIAINEGKSVAQDILLFVFLGIAGFAFYKFFFDLSISVLWIIVSPIVMVVSILFPGGVTILNLLLKKYSLIVLPTWGFISGILLDVIYAIIVIWVLVVIINNREKGK